MKGTLQKLKEIEPSEETLRSIKAVIDARIGIGKELAIPSPYFRKMNRYALAGCSMAVLMLAFSFTLKTDPTVETGLLSAKMAFSPNAHTKSQIALSSLEKNSVLVAQAGENTEAYERIENTVAISRKTLDTLQLMGEKDKYTLEECLGDYTQYYKTLSRMEEDLASVQVSQDQSAARLDALKDKIHDAKEEAEDRLGKYPENE